MNTDLSTPSVNIGLRSSGRYPIIDALVRKLNDQHRRHGAGFYHSVGTCRRYFRARRVGAEFQVFDFERWVTIPTREAIFHDHNGRDL